MDLDTMFFSCLYTRIMVLLVIQNYVYCCLEFNSMLSTQHSLFMLPTCSKIFEVASLHNIRTDLF